MTEAATTAMGAKVASTAAGAGLIASIVQDADFYVLFVVAVMVSSMSYLFDKAQCESPRSHSVPMWFKYLISGQALMFLTFYGLTVWVPPENQLPQTVWLALAAATAGWSVNILEHSGGLAKRFSDQLVSVAVEAVKRWTSK